MLYDVFICHASEDKEHFVRPLADALRNNNVEVWYDEFSLKIGDSLRRSIDRGLRSSRFGVVVLSKPFFSKNWPQYELDGLVEREITGGDKVLLPIWCNITHDEVYSYSPSLAGRKAAVTDRGLDEIVTEILSVIHPHESPLIRARDVLLGWGVTPPVITDEYWLDIVEASNRIPAYGALIPEESAWGSWSFPLPLKDSGPEERGDRLAWTAMQMAWTKAAEEQSISPITHPEKILEFINEYPGLYETCEIYIDLLAEYAPQLIIPGFGGDLESIIEAAYKKNCEKWLHTAKSNSRCGSGLTVTGKPPTCDEEWALRSPHFGNYEASSIAGAYFSGGIFGPPVSPYEHSEHLFWLLSNSSKWLPDEIHEKLLEGMASWGVWVWTNTDHIKEGNVKEDALMNALYKCTDRQSSFQWTPVIETEVLCRIDFAIEIMGLEDRREDILSRFMEHDLVGKYLTVQQAHRERHAKNEG